MVEPPMTLNIKRFFPLILIFLIATNVAILLNIPFLRQVFGFLFLTILPGVLILQILKLNKMGSTEKFVLSVGLSVSFLMFFGLLVNNLSLYFGYETPLATIPLLISFNLSFIVLATIGCMINREPIFSFPNLNLTTPEKAFLIVPVLFPALSIFGMHVMNTTDNNIILMLLLFLIPTYVLFVCFFNQKFPERLYPIVIFLISISLLLLRSLRSNHLIGDDTHAEYYFFQITLDNLHWSVFGHSTLSACLSISLLPTIYQSILSISPEFLFKILHSFIFSISPLVVYIISKKYIGNFYALLVSFSFMAQVMFLMTPSLARTNTAILFFALVIMVLFHDGLRDFNKKLFIIIFVTSCILSHYSTTYIFFFVLLFTWIGMWVLPKLGTRKRKTENLSENTSAEGGGWQVAHFNSPRSRLKNGTNVTITLLTLFFAVLFFWYSQITVAAFDRGVGFIHNTFVNLNELFLLESRGGTVMSAAGKGVSSILQWIKFVVNWLTIVLVFIGVLITLMKRQQMVSDSDNSQQGMADFLKSKIDAEYVMLSLICIAMLTLSVILPFVLKGYALNRMHFMMMVVLSLFLVIGGITLSNSLKLRPYIVTLVIIVLYFMSNTSVLDQTFSNPLSISLNSKGPNYDYFYVHDQDSYGGRWLGDGSKLGDGERPICTDVTGRKLVSQADIPQSFIDTRSIFDNDTKIDGYIYLRHHNVIDGKLLDSKFEDHNLTECDKFIDKGKIYNNGGSEVWK
jgi:uncharacterized membrane protein